VLATGVQERYAHRAATRAVAELRAQVLAHAAALGPRWGAAHGGEAATLLTRGLDALEPYFVRYLPQLLLAVTVTPGALAVVLKGDLAPPTLTDGLLAAGYRVEARTAYRTHGRAPDPDVRDVLLAADALTLASGSAARSWADAVGTATPPVVVAIGPTTEAAAADAGIVVTHVAATHDLEGLAEAVVAAFEGPP